MNTIEIILLTFSGALLVVLLIEVSKFPVRKKKRIRTQIAKNVDTLRKTLK
ncbi:hypothetical protein [Pasteurella testudinis]|uniref:hypothetical protein n=1 Tax=Pasteurella testudinis TaxID=761 RepID=UPI004057F5EB